MVDEVILASKFPQCDMQILKVENGNSESKEIGNE